MDERSRTTRAHDQDGRSSAPSRRPIAATLIAVLVFVIQIGPALACDVFDGPGRPGCPGLFYPEGVPPLGDGDRQTPDDCSDGPSYLALEVQPLELHPRMSGGGGDGVPMRVSEYESLAQRWDVSSFRALAPSIRGPDAQQRYAYLQTRRLRI